MTKIILEGGTDVAEVALFCSDSIPQDMPDYEIADALQNEHSLVRLPTGGDGGYLLHIYVDEEIDSNLSQYCIKDDVIKRDINFKKGNIAFGGIESAFVNFKPNKNIRSDSTLPVGSYKATFFQTDYPESLIEDRLIKDVGKEQLKYVSTPSTVLIYSFFIAMFLLIWTITRDVRFGLALVIFLSAVYFWYKKYTRSAKFIEIENKVNAVNNQFPSIVAQLTRKTQ